MFKAPAMLMSPIALLIQCTSLQEAEVAWNAVQAYRSGSPAASSTTAPDPHLTLAAQIEAALRKAPMNRQKEIVLTALRDSPPEAWVAYPDLQGIFTAEGFTPEQTAAALRDLSWQMGEFLPAQETAGFGRKIEVLAERARAGGIYRYRLTKAGRTAVEHVFR